MHTIIAPSFFHKKYCVLPGIGKLTLVTQPATSDFTNQLIEAPVQQIIFTPSVQNDYLFNEFSAISDLIKRKLEEQGLVDMPGIGRFTKAPDGSVDFAAATINEDLLMPVEAKRAVRENAVHNILVGDKETTNTVMAEMLTEEEPVSGYKRKWWVWALTIAAIALLLIALYIYQNGVNNFSSNLSF